MVMQQRKNMTEGSSTNLKHDTPDGLSSSNKSNRTTDLLITPNQEQNGTENGDRGSREQGGHSFQALIPRKASSPAMPH